MSFQHGIYGIAYDERQRSPLRRVWLVLLLVSLLVAPLIFWRGCAKSRRRAELLNDEPGQTRYQVPEVEATRERPSIWRHFINYRRGVKPPEDASGAAAAATARPQWLEAEGEVAPAAPIKAQSPEVRRLMEQVEACERRDDLLGARLSLRQLLQLTEAAEFRDPLARKLGQINTTLLFEKRPMPGKAQHRIVAGDLIGKLTRQYGCTQAYLLNVNGIDRPDRLRIGQELWVLDNPDFELTVGSSAGSAILSLNGEFCKRYQFWRDSTASPLPIGTFSVRDGILGRLSLRASDIEELRTLMPATAAVVILE